MGSAIRADAIGPQNGSSFATRIGIKATEAISANQILQIHASDKKALKVRKASAAAISTTQGRLLVARHLVPINQYGEAFEWALLENVSTEGATVGDPVFLGADGAWAATPPSGGVSRVIGMVTVVSATVGSVLIDPNGALMHRYAGINPLFLMPGFTKGYGGVPVVFEKQTANAVATVTIATLLAAGEVIDAWAIKTDATGSTTDALTLKDGDGNTIATFALDGVAAGGIVRATSVSQTHKALAAGEALQVTTAKTTDCRALIYVSIRPTATAY